MISKKNIALLTVLFLSPLTTFAAPLASSNGHLYVNVGTSAYYLNNPNLYVDNVASTSRELGKINNNGFTPQYNLAVGYQYQNDSNSWVTKVFGHTNSIEVKYDYFNTNQARINTDPTNGALYYIDGSGLIRGVSSYSITKRSLRAKHQRSDIEVYFKGHQNLSNPKISFEPFVGFVHNNLKSHYSASTDYSSGLISDTDNVKIDSQVEQFGVAFGNQFNLHVTKQFLTFLNLELQLLHANAFLNAKQYPIDGVTPTFNPKYIHDSAKKSLTYRAIAALGIEYRFFNKPDSISISVKGGIDRWGFNPEIVMPNNTNTRAVHLSNHAQNNFFGNVELHVPMG